MEDIMDNIVCNKCGRTLKAENGIIHEDFIHVCKSWGYFSRRDGRTWEFIICEECMEKIEREFIIPSKEYETTEMI